jgi:predicted TIM-barrel fold metal-dependent hydrolase
MKYEQLDLATVFRRALAVAGPQRLLFGSDSSFFPRGWNSTVFEQQSRVVRSLDITSEQARLIFGENLERLLGDNALTQ